MGWRSTMIGRNPSSLPLAVGTSPRGSASAASSRATDRSRVKVNLLLPRLEWLDCEFASSETSRRDSHPSICRTIRSSATAALRCLARRRCCQTSPSAPSVCGCCRDGVRPDGAPMALGRVAASGGCSTAGACSLAVDRPNKNDAEHSNPTTASSTAASSVERVAEARILLCAPGLPVGRASGSLFFFHTHARMCS